jgi:hypothetical protein
MAAAHPGKSWWIIAGRIFGTDDSLTFAIPRGGKIPWHHGRSGGYGDAVEEIPARDLAMHSQLAVP